MHFMEFEIVVKKPVDTRTLSRALCIRCMLQEKLRICYVAVEWEQPKTVWGLAATSLSLYGIRAGM